VFGHGVARRLAEPLQYPVAPLEQMHLEPVCGERLGHLDADVAAADDADGAATVLEVLTRWTAVRLLPGRGLPRTGDELPQLLAVAHRAEGVHAAEIDPVDRRFERLRAGRDEQAVVRLDRLAVVASSGYGFGIGIDVDDLVSGPEVDVALLAELLGRDRDERLQGLDLTFYIVR